MTRYVPISDFKDNASQLVAAAELGEEIAITRHGKIAARLIAPERQAPFDRAAAEAAMERILARRDKMAAEGRIATVEDWIAWKNEGQR